MRHDPYIAFRSPGFGRFILGHLMIHIGAAAQSLAIGWEIYARTDSAWMLGLVGLTQAAPLMIFTLPAGYLADIWDRRRLMVLGLSGATLTSLALAFFSLYRGAIGWMYALLFLDAAFHRLAGPAAAALTPLLVPPQQLENAIKWRSSIFQISSVVGPALGGFLVALWLPSAYLFSAATTMIFIALLSRLSVRAETVAAPGRMLARIGEGLRFVRSQPIVLGAISLDMVAVLLGGATYLLPIFARDILTDRPFGLSSEQALGWLRAAPALGAFAMALILAHRPPIRRAGRALLLAVAAFGVATIVFGLSQSFPLSFAMLFLTGFFDNISVVVRHTVVQLRTPNAMRGRVSAVNSIFIGSSNELGGFESGLVARLWNPVASVVSGGIGTILCVALWAWRFPELRQFGRIDTKEPEEPTAA